MRLQEEQTTCPRQTTVRRLANTTALFEPEILIACTEGKCRAYKTGHGTIQSCYSQSAKWHMGQMIACGYRTTT